MMRFTLIKGGLNEQLEATKSALGGMTMTEKAREDKKDEVITRYISISEAFKGKKFESFDDLRLASNKIVNDARNDWVTACLVKHGVILNTKRRMTKREIVKVFDDNEIILVREADDKTDYDVMYKEKKIIGKWDNKRQLHFGDKTEKLYVKIEYSLY